MDVLRNVLLLLHLIGFAAIAGGALGQLTLARPTINRFIMDGAWAQLVTGMALVLLGELGPYPVNHAKVGVKLVVLIVIIVLAFANRKKESISKGTLWSLLGLTVVNAGVATLWH